VPDSPGHALGATPLVTLVTGPVRSGKSRHAEHLLAAEAHVTYLATGPAPQPEDAAWAERVSQHRARRPSTWVTLETTDVETAVAQSDSAILLDCLGTWLTAVVDAVGWDDLDRATAEVRRRSAALVRSLVATRRRVVVVTNEVGWSLVPTTPSGRFFQDELGRLNAAVAAVAGTVHLVVAGRVVDLSQAPLVPTAPPAQTYRA
jgi:adenosylcobinamide kinase/adenosylcobinamide-phosphate guanylyltransferase